MLLDDRYATVDDLAHLTFELLEERGKNPPTIDTLELLFRVMFSVSHRTEELAPITFQITWIDPDRPDPDPPERVVEDRWIAVRLTDHVAFDIDSLTKIARATDPRASSLAVYGTARDGIFIWGLIDQENQAYDFTQFEARSGSQRPGTFNAAALGSGRLTVLDGYETLAELHVDELVQEPLNALRSGSVSAALDVGIAAYIESVRARIPSAEYEQRGHWDDSLRHEWIETLVRLILRIRRMGHGGALLITSEESMECLDIKYALTYTRLPRSLLTAGVSTIKATTARDLILDTIEAFEPPEPTRDAVPVVDYLTESVEDATTRDARSELNGAIWFVACLTRVDGLVVLSPDLTVRGFGAVIHVEESPDHAFVALDEDGTPELLNAVPIAHYGTRHQSMMRYCNAVPSSIGFVISQDGDVRVIRKVDDHLIMWDNVQLRREIYAGEWDELDTGNPDGDVESD